MASLIFSILILLVAAGPEAMDLRQPAAHRGHEKAIELQTGERRVVIVPAWAGRLSILDLGFGNLLWQDPLLDGKTLPADSNWMPWDGNATDLVGDHEQRQWPDLWLHPWTAFRRSAEQATVTSPAQRDTAVVLTKTYALSDSGDELTYRVSVTGGKEPAHWTVWERALVPADLTVIAPLNQAVPEPWHWRDPAQVAGPEHAHAAEGYLVLRAGVDSGRGLAAILERGWIALVRGANVAVLRYDLDPSGAYPFGRGANAVFWLAPEKVEIEPLSPHRRTEPGQTWDFTMRWQALDLPPQVAEEGAAAIGRWIDRELAADAGAAPLN